MSFFMNPDLARQLSQDRQEELRRSARPRRPERRGHRFVRRGEG